MLDLAEVMAFSAERAARGRASTLPRLVEGGFAGIITGYVLHRSNRRLEHRPLLDYGR
jgi:hypothetical protein